MKRTVCWTWISSSDQENRIDPAERTADDVLLRDDGRRYGAHREGLSSQCRASLVWLDLQNHRKNVRVQAFEVAMDRKQEMFAAFAGQGNGKVPGVRADQARNRTDCESLNRKGFSAAMIHGDRSQYATHFGADGFQQGRFRVLVATDLARAGSRAGHRSRHH